MTYAPEIRTFVTGHFGIAPDAITDDTSLLEARIIDSMGIVESISHVETTYGLIVPDEDVEPKHFDSINAIAAYLTEKLSGARR